MALTALEWLKLNTDERERRKGELSPHECFLLRTTYSMYDGFNDVKVVGHREMTPDEEEKAAEDFFKILKETKVIPQNTDLETFKGYKV